MINSAKLCKITGQRVDVVIDPSPVMIYVIGNSIGPDTIADGDEAQIATLNGPPSREDAIKLLSAIHYKDMSCFLANSANCPLYAFDNAVQGIREFLSLRGNQNNRAFAVVTLPDRSKIVKGLTDLPGSRLLGIPEQIIKQMGFQPMTIRKGSYRNTIDVLTATDRVVVL